MAELNFTGFRTSDEVVGIRNRVLVLSLNSFCNATVDIICQAIDGTTPIVHPHGRNEVGIYKERLESSLLGFVLNGNVQAVLVVGYEPESTTRFVEMVKEKTNKPIEKLVVLGNGTLDAARLGAEVALNLVYQTSRKKREAIQVSDLIIGVKCGGSDTTSSIVSNPAVGYVVDWIISNGGTAIFSETTEIIGAEHILVRRAANQEVANRIKEAAEANERLAKSVGIDLLGVNPVPDNIRGGITTIEEKSLGAILKTGKSTIQDVLKYGQAPTRPGLHFMDSPSAATEVMTGLSAAGAQLILFSTGTGNPVGNRISPVLKITGNPRTVTSMGSHIDVDISDVITQNSTIEKAGEEIIRVAVEVVNGALTKAEILHHNEFALIPVGL